MTVFEKPPIVVKSHSEDRYELYSKKNIKITNKEVDELFFASTMIQKNFVGFYFFPIYTHPYEFKNISQELKKCLKGKSCFHIKKLDDNLEKQIRKLLEDGFELYKKEKYA